MLEEQKVNVQNEEISVDELMAEIEAEYEAEQKK